jgi:hypothetical protein
MITTASPTPGAPSAHSLPLFSHYTRCASCRRTSEIRVHSGVSVERVSRGATIPAERSLTQLQQNGGGNDGTSAYQSRLQTDRIRAGSANRNQADEVARCQQGGVGDRLRG